MFTVESLKQFVKNTCVISRKHGANETTYTYDEVIKSVEELCSKFQAIEVPKSTCFAIRLKDQQQTVGSISILIAILNHHCHFYPLQKDIDLNIDLNDCDINFLVTNDKDAMPFEFKAELKIFDEVFFLYAVRNSLISKRFNKICYIIGTSGSTGRPKRVYVPYDCIAPNIYGLSARFAVTADDVIFLGTPFTFDPFIVELFLALSCGASLLTIESRMRLAPSKLLDLLWPNERNMTSATIVQTTPSMFRQFGVEAIRDIILAEKSSLRVLVLGGEDFPKNEELRKWLKDDNIVHKRIFNIYGITEISCWSTIHELKSTEITDGKRTPIGEPIDDEIKLRIVELSDDSSDGHGELFIGSSTRVCIIPELDDADLVIDKVNPLYRSTGDLVKRNEIGDIIYIGRMNNVVKRMGKRLNLDALENIIEKLFAPAECITVICLWNESKHSLVCCIHRYAETEDKQKFIQKKHSIMQDLLSYEKPDCILEIQQLPLNEHGKIDRKELLKIINTTEITSPVNIFQHFLTETLALPVKGSSTSLLSKRIKMELSHEIWDKSFSDLGGTSFNALSLSTEIGKNLKNAFDQRRLLEILLDPNVSIADIMMFLQNAPIYKFPERKNEDIEDGTESNTPFAKKLEQLWRIDLQKCVDATPAVDIGQRFVCIGSHAHLLITIESSNGKEISRLKLRDRIECEVAFVSNESALIGCSSGYLYAFNFMSGEINWSLKIGSKVKAKPLIIPHTLLAIIGYYDENFNSALICLKIGKKPIHASPIQLDNETVLMCTLDGTFECVNILSGNALWSRRCASPIFSTPAVIDNGVLFSIAEVGGKVHICKNENGDTLQSFSVEGNIFSSITVSHDNDKSIKIIFGCHDRHIYCLSNTLNSIGKSNCSNFIVNWKTMMESAVYVTPKVINFNENVSYIIACDTGGTLAVLDFSTGIKVATYRVEGEVFSSPCTIGNFENEIRIYFGCRDNYLYCFRLK